MSIKDNLPAAPRPALGGFTVLALEGPDAEAFAQAQFMNDVRLLEPGQWQWSGWLNAKGRVIALFALLRRHAGCLWLVLPDVAAEALAKRLQVFVFRSKLRLTPLTELITAADWTQATTEAAQADRVQTDAEGGAALDFGSPDAPRRLWLLPAGHPVLAPAQAENDARWREFDIVHGWPRLDSSQAEAWTPQMLSLERLAAYSVKKGCYPGQEIVARTHFLGQAKRALTGLAGQGLSAGQALCVGDQAVGQVIAADRDGRQALAVLAAETPGELHNGAQVCARIALRDGLRRPV